MTAKQTNTKQINDKKELPIGISSFPKMVERDFIYVDKTRYVYLLLKRSGIYLYTRPRRFGKSLLVSMLKEIFSGNRALFKDCWIYDRIEWNPYPVIHLDFLDMDYRTLGLEKALSNKLDKIAKQYGVESDGDSSKEKFGNLIENLSEDRRVVVLVDEYDKPIIDYLESGKLEKAAENRDSLRNFFSILKSRDKNIEFLFITGISRFSKVSVFSDLNHLNDITFHPEYSKMLGFDRGEIEAHFSYYIRQWIERNGGTREELLVRLKEEYNGYSWDGSHFVYNPHSIHKFFDEMTFGNFWFETGTPGFLVRVIMEKGLNIEEWENLRVRRSFFSQFDIENVNPGLLLFQSGYLTIKGFDGERYLLSYPNKEVQSALFHFLLEKYSNKSHGDVEKIIPGMREALVERNMESFIETIRVLFSDIPYNISLPRYEAYYHSLIHIVLKLSGIEILSEKETNLGRIDAAVETADTVYVMEFKMGTSNKALQQILEKKYYEPFRLKGKEIVLLGVGFDPEKRNVSGFKYKTLAPGESLP